MASVRTWSTYSRAEAVLAVIKTLMDEDAPDSEDIFVGGFKNGGNTGLKLTDGLGLKQCNLFGSPKGDGIVAVVGEVTDFNSPFGEAKDSAECHYFAHDDFYLAAKFVIAWLCKGEILNLNEG